MKKKNCKISHFFLLSIASMYFILGHPSRVWSQDISLITYNVGLAEGHVKYAAERLTPVIHTLKTTTADVACVQEVWKSQDRDQIIAALAKEYPYATSFDNPRELAPRCSLFKLAPALSCVKKNCTGGETSGDTLACGLEHCESAIYNLGGDCFSCLSHYFPITSALNASAKCLAHGPKYVFEGQNGLLLLSKYPVLQAKKHSFESTLVKRDVIEANIDHPRTGETKIFCTHLQNNSTAPYFGSEGNWEQEQGSQIKSLTKIVKEKLFDEKKIFILGDMNTGPSGVALDGEFPQNYALFEKAGFDSIYLANGGQNCTWCGDNNTLTGNHYRNIIDHVFLNQRAFSNLKDVQTEIFGQRLFRLMFDYSDKDGIFKEIDSPASDHYGVKVSITY